MDQKNKEWINFIKSLEKYYGDEHEFIKFSNDYNTTLLDNYKKDLAKKYKNMFGDIKVIIQLYSFKNSPNLNQLNYLSSTN